MSGFQPIHNALGKINPVQIPANQANQVRQEPENVFVALAKKDPDYINAVRNNPDEKTAEALMDRKLKEIGLDDREAIVLKMAQAYKIPADKAMETTGLAKDQLDALYDSAIEKVRVALGVAQDPFLKSVKSAFGANGNLYK